RPGEHRHRRAWRRARVRSAGWRGACRRRLPGRLAGEGKQRSGWRRGGDAQRGQRSAGDRCGKERINQIAPGLPPGVRIVPFYDRSTLNSQSADTLRRALVEEVVLVTLVQALFLLHLRSILIVTL